MGIKEHFTKAVVLCSLFSFLLQEANLTPLYPNPPDKESKIVVFRRFIGRVLGRREMRAQPINTALQVPAFNNSGNDANQYNSVRSESDLIYNNLPYELSNPQYDDRPAELREGFQPPDLPFAGEHEGFVMSASSESQAANPNSDIDRIPVDINSPYGNFSENREAYALMPGSPYGDLPDEDYSRMPHAPYGIVPEEEEPYGLPPPLIHQMQPPYASSTTQFGHYDLLPTPSDVSIYENQDRSSPGYPIDNEPEAHAYELSSAQINEVNYEMMPMEVESSNNDYEMSARDPSSSFGEHAESRLRSQEAQRAPSARRRTEQRQGNRRMTREETEKRREREKPSEK